MTTNKTHPRAGGGTRSVITFGVLAAGAITTNASTDYGPAIWNPLPNYYTSGNGHKFHVVHDMEGYYHSVKSVLQNRGLSVHYATNGKKDASSDAAPGEISQFVRDAHYGIHANCWNTHSTGTEHEGFASNPAWFTEEQYQASAGITRNLANKFGWAKDRNHIVGHGEKSNAAWRSYASANLGINASCNTHTDPGPYWNWSHYINLVNGSSTLDYAPAICSWGTNRLDIFVRGADNGLWHRWIDGNVAWSWSAWEKLGDNLTSDPAACCWGPGRIDVFVRDLNGGLSHRAFSLSQGGWQPWVGLGGQITSAPSACSWGPNRIDVYAKDPANGLGHRWFVNGVWSAWENVGSNITSAPSACAWGPNRNDVFVRDGLNGLSHRWYDNSPWNGWVGLGGTITSAPGVCTWGVGRIDVFAKDPNNGLGHRTYLNGTWGAWANIGSDCTSAPSAACWGVGRIDVVVRAINNNIGHRWYVDGAWSAWEDLGRPN